MASGKASVAVLILTACANGLRRRMCAAGGRGNDHFRGLRCTPRPAAYARKSNRDLHLLTPLSAQVVGQGFMTFSRPARTTRRSNVEQVWPPCRPLYFANPSPIMPKHPPHTAHVRVTPNAPTHARSSCAACAVWRLFLWRRVDEEHGSRSSSIFVRAGAKPWVVLGVVVPPFPAAAVAEYGSRDRLFSA